MPHLDTVPPPIIRAPREEATNPSKNLLEDSRRVAPESGVAGALMEVEVVVTGEVVEGDSEEEEEAK